MVMLVKLLFAVTFVWVKTIISDGILYPQQKNTQPKIGYPRFNR